LKYNILVVIPLLNPSNDFFTKIMPMLYEQTPRPHILLISSSGELPKGDYESIIIDKKDFNHANTRNIAMQYESDFYLFMTQDATAYDKYLIDKLLVPFTDKEIVISYARQTPYENAHITEKFARNKNYPMESIIKSKADIYNLGIKTFFSSDSCALYRGDYFRENFGFKKDLNTSEDMEFAARAIFDNKKIAYCADAQVYHSHVYTVSDLYKRYVAIGEFFQQNPWIQESIKETLSTERVGFQQVIEEMKYIGSKQPSALIRSFLFTITKYLGYSIGKYF